MTPVRLEPATPRSRIKHSTTVPLRSLDKGLLFILLPGNVFLLHQLFLKFSFGNTMDPDRTRGYQQRHWLAKSPFTVTLSNREDHDEARQKSAFL